MTTTTFDILEMIEKLRHDESLSAREALSQLALDLKRRFEDGYFGDLYRTTYEVTGRGAFPVDMMRYAVSWPHDEADTHAIEESLESGSMDDQFTVKLSKYHRDPKPQLAEDRWLSKFRWKVLRVIDTVPI